jgi:hypothetical protein
MVEKSRVKKPISREDQEVFDWIGRILQDHHDGKNVYLTDEEVERDKQEWLKTQKSVDPVQETTEDKKENNLTTEENK